jgi:putative tryptophan/tyrosine transport system substrate-binding protein
MSGYAPRPERGGSSEPTAPYRPGAERRGVITASPGDAVGRLPRREFLLVTASLLAAPGVAFAQETVRHVGVLAAASAVSFAARTEALRAGLQDFGYVEGKNLSIEFRSAEGQYDRLAGLAAELIQKKVDVIVTAGTPAIRAAKQATRTVPIVIAAVGDAVGGGMVGSLAKPGGNVTGATYFAPELAAKQLEMLKETVPRATRVAVVINPDNPAMGPTLRAVEAAGTSLKLELEQIAVRQRRDFEAAFETIARRAFRAALIIDDPITIYNARALADLALKHRLATVGFVEYAQAGGLIGYGVDLTAMWRRAAYFVDRILRGANAGEIPMERAMKFDLVVNLKTATAIGVTIEPSTLLRAERVIE